MPTHSLLVVAAGLVLTGSTGCATRGYVTRTVDERTREAEPPGSLPDQSTRKELRLRAERRIVVDALDANEWHISQTARELGLVDHASLLKIMRRHDLRRASSQ